MKKLGVILAAIGLVICGMLIRPFVISEPKAESHEWVSDSLVQGVGTVQYLRALRDTLIVLSEESWPNNNHETFELLMPSGDVALLHGFGRYTGEGPELSGYNVNLFLPSDSGWVWKMSFGRIGSDE